MGENPSVSVKFHNWWNAPKTIAKVQATDSLGSHASWSENFPWTRLAGVTLPDSQKLPPDRTGKARLVGAEMREAYGDGNQGGVYQRSDEEMLAIWRVAVEETRDLLAGDWD
jgi:creatinine amidohydrolase